MDVVDANRQVCRPAEKMAEKNLHDRKLFF